MDAQLTKALAPKFRKGNRYDLGTIKTTTPLDNSDVYHDSNKQLKGRISTYDKIVQELSKDENSSVGKPLLSILGGGDSNFINPKKNPGNNDNVGGTLTLYPSGGIHFQNIKPSFKVELPQVSQLSSETKGITNRGSTPRTKSPPQLLDFVEQFNKQEDENLSPDDFMDYRDSQAVELSTESDTEMVGQNDIPNNKTVSCELRNPMDNSYPIDNQSICNESSDDEQQLFPNTLTQLVSPIPTISSPNEISSLKEEIESTVSIKCAESPALTFKEKLPNITISSVIDNQSTLDLISRVPTFSGSSLGKTTEFSDSNDREHIISVSSQNSISNAVSWKSDDTINISTSNNSPSNQSTLDLISRVRSFSGSSFGRTTEPSDLNEREHVISVSPQNSISNAVSWKSDDTINLSTPKNKKSEVPIPPIRERKLSESVLGFFTGIFGNSPAQSISERSENIKEVAEMSMIFRY